MVVNSESYPELDVETKAGDSELPNKVIRVPPQAQAASSECRASITEAADSAPLPLPKLF